MITLNVNNKSDLLTEIALPWIAKKNQEEELSEFDYLSQLWADAFGVSGHDFADDYIDGTLTHWSNDYDDEDYYDSQNFLEGNKDTRILNLWEDEDEWDRVAHMYDSYTKSNEEINIALRSSYFPDTESFQTRHTSPVYSSNVFSSVEKNQKSKDDDWRKEILSELDADERHIFFYPNPREEKRKDEFLDLDEFLTYCMDNDIHIDDMASGDIEFFTQCHCGLDEYALSNGRKELRCARSYGELMYDLYGSDLFYDDNDAFAQAVTELEDY